MKKKKDNDLASQAAFQLELGTSPQTPLQMVSKG